MKSPPVLHRIAAPRTSSSGGTCPFLFSDSICLTTVRSLIHGVGLFNTTAGWLGAGSSLSSILQRPQVLSKLSIPRRNDDRDSSSGLRLARETNQRLWLSGVDVAELFDLFS